MEAVSAFAAGMDNRIEVKMDENQSFAAEFRSNFNNKLADNKERQSMVSSSSSTESDLTVLPEEVALISVGSDDSETTKLRKMKAVMRKKELHQQ